MTPAYDGKGQPAASQGWFSGLVAWWNRLTPQYATQASRGPSAPHPSGASSTTPTSSPPAPAGVTGKPADSSSTHCAASGTVLSRALGTAKP